MPKKWILLVLALTVVVLAVVPLLTRQAKPPVLVSRTDPPRIKVSEKSHALGTVQEGVEIPYVFKIFNVGGEPLIIQNVSTTCGCTLLNLKNKLIEPGKTGELEVVMDTTMKQGKVKKQIDIFSNDPEKPKISVYLEAIILAKPKSSKTNLGVTPLGNSSSTAAADPHANLTEMGKAKIFTGRCAVCHVQQGQGKRGGDLYLADCAMCHGQNAEGAVGPALVPGDYTNQDYVNRIQKTIRYGSDFHKSMPGYLREAGGPLTDAEIDSIVSFLKEKSQQPPPVSDRPGG